MEHMKKAARLSGCQVCTDNEGLLLLEVQLERLLGVHSFPPSCLATKDALFAHQGLEGNDHIEFLYLTPLQAAQH